MRLKVLLLNISIEILLFMDFAKYPIVFHIGNFYSKSMITHLQFSTKANKLVHCVQ